MKQLRELSMEQFESEVLGGTGEQYIQVTQTTCMPCKVVEAQFARLVEEKDIYIAKVNLTNTPQFTDKYDIMSTPTVLKFVDGKMVEKSSGNGHSMKVVGELSQ